MLSETKFLELYRHQQESGLTVKDFYSNEGISASTFYYWHKKVKNKKIAQDFIPLVLNPSQPVHREGYIKNHHPVHESISTNDTMLELEYPNGTRLRIRQDLDLAHLRTLVCLID